MEINKILGLLSNIKHIELVEQTLLLGIVTSFVSPTFATDDEVVAAARQTVCDFIDQEIFNEE